MLFLLSTFGDKKIVKHKMIRVNAFDGANTKNLTTAANREMYTLNAESFRVQLYIKDNVHCQS